MKLRKLVMFILVAIVLFGLNGVNAAAEETTTAGAPTTTISTIADLNTVTTVTEAAVVTEAATEATIEETSTDTNIDDTAKTTENKVTTKATTKKTTAAKYTKSELRLLSCLIFCEAGGESYTGKLAVGIVVVNRKNSSAFPDTIKGVIYQRSQFGPARNGSLSSALKQYDAGKFTSTAEKASIKAAKAALSGTKVITVAGKEKKFSKYLYFSGWLSNATYKLGNHQFK